VVLHVDDVGHVINPSSTF